MATIITRSGKGSALLSAEVDANFNNLNSDKAENAITVQQTDIGTAANEIPLNQFLGALAYQDRLAVNIGGGVAALSTATVTTIQNDTAISNVEPSLMLNFAAVEALDPRITYTRASTATYYNGVTTAVAEQNLLLQSQTFDNASWDKLGSTVTANATTAPDGTSTADLLVSTNAVTLSYLRQQPAIPTGGTDVLTVYAKYLNYQYVVLNIRTGASNRYCWFDVLNGVVGTNSSGGTASMQSVGSGWYRLILSRANEGSTMQCNFYVATTDASLTIAGDGVSGNYFWGAQVEKRDQATAYTPTTTQPITNYIPVLLTAASGVPRFDHNPISGDSLGLLVEQQSTNLATQSQTFTTWAKTAATVTNNVAVAPDGTLTSSSLIPTATSTGHGMYFAASLGSGTFTFSVYAKQAGYPRLGMRVYDGTTYQIYTTFDISIGTIVSNTAGTATITPVGNGWYRCTCTGTSASGNMGATAGWVIESLPAANTVQQVFLGNGYSGAYVWGAQIEAGAFSTSYIVTVASQVTRAADAASMTGTNFSSWYTQGEGTLYVESLAQNTAAANNKNLRFSDGTTSNEIWLGSGSSGTSARSQITLGGVNYFDGGATNQVTAGQFGKYVVSFETNNAVLCANGTLSVVDTAVPIPSSINQFAIIPPSQRAGYYKKIVYYPRRLSNEELQEMTS